MELEVAVSQTRQYVAQQLVEAGMTPFAGTQLAAVLAAGDDRTVLVVGHDELHREDGQRGVPAPGDVVTFAFDGANFALAVRRAMYGAGKIGMVGVMGGLAVPLITDRAYQQQLWKCWTRPQVNTHISMPREDPGLTSLLGELRAETLGLDGVPTAQRITDAQEAWEAYRDAYDSETGDGDEGSTLIGSMEQFEAVFGKGPGYGWMIPEFAPLSVREGGWRKRLGWRVRGVRGRLARRLAPWWMGSIERENQLAVPRSAALGPAERLAWTVVALDERALRIRSYEEGDPEDAAFVVTVGASPVRAEQQHLDEDVAAALGGDPELTLRYIADRERLSDPPDWPLIEAAEAAIEAIRRGL
jgi:hypothetical protein